MQQLTESAETLPGSYGWPVVGQSFELFFERELFFWKQFQRYGPVFKTHFMGMKTAVLVGSDANQLVLKDQVHKFSMKVGWSFLEPLLGDGLILQEGENHQATRRLMAPAFHGQAITNYFNIIHTTVKNCLRGWPEHIPLQIVEQLRQLTLLIACKLLMGSDNQEEISELSQWFIDFVEGIPTVVRLNIPITKFGRAQVARRKLENYIQSVITQRRESGEEFQDVLGILLSTTDEYGNKLNDSEVVTQTLQLLFAGHESTVKFLCWALFELSLHPEWSSRLRDELNCVVGEEELKMSHLRQLTQMGYLLQEIERLYPPPFFIPRGVIQGLDIAGYYIPPKWLVMVSPLLSHRLPEVFDNPNCFDPNRFAPPREEHKKHPFALIGFGGGPHKCLGYEFAQLEMKTTLCILLQYFNWKIIPKPASLLPVLQPSKIELRLQMQVKRICNDFQL